MNLLRFAIPITLAAGFLVTALPTDAQSDDLMDTYVARLSRRDHLNSSGKKLTTVAAIVRQDRANYHRYGRRDPEDERDTVFDDEKNRTLLEKKLANGLMSSSTRKSILNGTPLIRVKIYRKRVDIAVVPERNSEEFR